MSTNHHAIDGEGRERRPYRLNFLFEKLRGFTRTTDSHLEDALVCLTDGYADDGLLDANEEREIIRHMFLAYSSNGKVLGITNLLDASSLEEAQREIERHELRSRKG